MKRIYDKSKINAEIMSLRKKLAVAVSRRDMVKMSQLQMQIQHQQALICEIEDYERFDLKEAETDKNKRNWAVKCLSLSINDADLAIYHLEMFFSYFAERGFTSRQDWSNLKSNLEKSLNEFRSYANRMFSDNDKNMNLDDFSELESLIRDRIFTDREKVYYDEYAEKS